MQGEGYLFKEAGAGQPVHFQDGLAHWGFLLWIELIDGAAYHVLDQHFGVGLPDIPGADVVPVTQHGDPVGQAVDILQPVGNEDDGGALCS